MSKVIILILSFLIASADNFNFSELRYSNALDKSIELRGEIGFLKNGLYINYKDSKKSLHLDGDKLIYQENGEDVVIDEEKAEKIIQYFEIIILLHNQDDKLIKSMFDIETSDEKTILKPIQSIKHFITHIELVKKQKYLKKIKLFLKNSDYIIIKIDDEIR